MGRIVGIDLGTTHSLVADYAEGRPEIIANRSGRRLTPSVVGLDRSDRIIVGDPARQQLATAPDRTVHEVKRLMGTDRRVRLGDREYTPQEISAFVLRALKEDAEALRGGTVDEAVITVPAYFTDAARQATKDAGELAGLKVERILNEPTAAALAYGLGHLDAEQVVVVYDLGGGTFDVSVLEMFEGVLDVKASAGNNQLGGTDFDAAIMAWLAERFGRVHGVDPRLDPAARARLKAAAEQAKIDLSRMPAAEIVLPNLALVAGRPVTLEAELTRATFEGLVGDLARATLGPIEQALKDARVDRRAVTDVVLVGGSTRMPLVQQLVSEFFGRTPHTGVHPDEAIALGAAVQAGIKTGAVAAETGIMITDVCPFTLGIEVQGGGGLGRVGGLFSPIIPRNSTVPVSRTEVYSTVAEGQKAVDIRVYQGEARLVRNNVFLAEYSVGGLPPGKAGQERVAVTFTYDVNGLLNVATKVVSTGKEERLVVDRGRAGLNVTERADARARVDAEWRGAAAAAPEAPVAPTAPAAAPVSTALLDAARERAEGLGTNDRVQLAQLVAAHEEALRGGEPARIARTDAALTDFLFALA